MSMQRGGNGIEFKYRAVDAQAASHPPPLPSSGYSYLAEQAARAGYMAPGIGRIHGNFQNPILVREAIQRELEKERIREEIILSEIAWRRLLEAEVRREMMLERELALRERECNVFDRFSFLPGAGMRFETSGLSFGRGLGWSLGERIAMPLEERFGNSTRHEIEGHKFVHSFERSVEPETGARHDMILFQQRAVEPKIEEVTLTSEPSKAKEKIVFLATPEQVLSRGKRKSIAPPEEGKSERPLIGVLKKKVKKDWSCAVCEVSATSERGLKEHIQGKKHKTKEAALMAQKNGKNFGIGIQPKRTAMAPVFLSSTTNNSLSEQGEKSTVQLLQSKQTGESSLQELNELPPVGVIPKDEVLEAGNQDQLANKKKFKFWCEMCCVGAFSKTVMEAHRTGKKHAMRLQEATKNITVPIPHTDSTDANKPNSSYSASQNVV